METRAKPEDTAKAGWIGDVRPLEARDAADVARLCGQLGYPATREQVLSRVAQLATDEDHRIFVASDAAGRVVGLVHVEGRHGLFIDPFVQIFALVVDEEHHGRGIGKLLMQEAERWAQKRGYAETTVYTNIVRVEAHRFYARLGYTPVKTSHVLQKAL